MIKKVFVGLLCAVLFVAGAFAEVTIPQEKRVKNFESGCCVWCALENLGNVHGIHSLSGIAKYRHENYGKKEVWVEGTYMIDQWGNWVQIEGPHWSTYNEAPGTPDRVKEEFTRLKVDYELQHHGDRSMKLIEKCLDKKRELGCAVGLKDYPREGCYHMVTLTDLDDKKFVFIENNYDCPRVEKTREWFDEHWTGYTIAVYPPKASVKEDVKKN